MDGVPGKGRVPRKELEREGVFKVGCLRQWKSQTRWAGVGVTGGVVKTGL